ncbi:hypothetical protein [Amycolatopsis sp. NPDC058986]|uniref:hypothetical protein n=1 Tax=unclassified Amycolatopsis TaxID=2618356 RepID=UPI00366BBCC9
MTALIYVDLAHLHPIVDGVWHRAWLGHLPVPGEVVVMLCDVQAPAAYDDYGRRDTHSVARQCWRCEEVYRAEMGFAPPPGGYPHASGVRSVPHPRPRGSA